MGTLNLSSVAVNPVVVGEVDLSRLNDLPSSFDLNPLRRSNRVNIRLRAQDINTLEARALEAGMPFHAFLADIIHQYAMQNTEQS